MPRRKSARHKRAKSKRSHLFRSSLLLTTLGVPCRHVHRSVLPKRMQSDAVTQQRVYGEKFLILQPRPRVEEREVALSAGGEEKVDLVGPPAAPSSESAGACCERRRCAGTASTYNTLKSCPCLHGEAGLNCKFCTSPAVVQASRPRFAGSGLAASTR